MLHTFGPVRLRLEVLGDLPSLQIVLLLRLLVLHQSTVHHVHFVRLICLPRPHLLHELVQFISGRLPKFVHRLTLSSLSPSDDRVLLILIVGVWHDSGRTHGEIATRVNLDSRLLAVLVVDPHGLELLACSATMGTLLAHLAPPAHLGADHLGRSVLHRLGPEGAPAFRGDGVLR